jgi:glyceraldehyde 3-phosphate dehydrogenase
MTIRVAINGYGRIGRNILRAHFSGMKYPDINIVAINDLASAETHAHLTRYDSSHGKFAGTVRLDSNAMFVNDNKISIFAERNPQNLPWRDLAIDVVYECTGLFTTKEKAATHIAAGAKKVLISAPGSNVDATVVYGVNQYVLTAQDAIISNASCTTNCLANIIKPLHDTFGIENGLMNTIHSYTNDQQLLDVHHSDLRRARAAALSMIPTSTGAAAAVGLVLPSLHGKLDGFAIRVPTANVSVVDFTFLVSRNVSIAAINDAIYAAASESKGVLQVNSEPLVSIDFNHNDASAIFDTSYTKVQNKLVKVLAWYDNEWGFSNRMLDVTAYLMSLV